MPGVPQIVTSAPESNKAKTVRLLIRICIFGLGSVRVATLLFTPSANGMFVYDNDVVPALELVVVVGCGLEAIVDEILASDEPEVMVATNFVNAASMWLLRRPLSLVGPGIIFEESMSVLKSSPLSRFPVVDNLWKCAQLADKSNIERLLFAHSLQRLLVVLDFHLRCFVS